MEELLTLHSIVRWIVVLVAAVALVKFTLGWLRHANPNSMDRGLTSGFSGLMDLQALLGLIYLVWGGFAGVGFPAFRLEHGGLMIVAAAVAHLPMRWRNETGPLVLRNNALVIVAVLVIVILGVGIPLGWYRWT